MWHKNIAGMGHGAVVSAELF